MKRAGILTLYLAHTSILILMGTTGTTLLAQTGLTEYRAEKLSYLLGLVLLFILYLHVLDKDRGLLYVPHVDKRFMMTMLQASAAVLITGLGLLGIQVYLTAQLFPATAESFWNSAGSTVVVAPDNKYLGLNSGLINIILFLAVQMIAAPIVEELLFRGVVLRRLLAQHSRLTAVLLTSVAFAVMHKQRLWLTSFVFSIILCHFFIRQPNLWNAAIIHGMNNLLAWLYGGFGGISYLESKSPEQLADISSWIPDLFATLAGAGLSIWILLRLSPPTPPSPSPAAAGHDPDRA